MVRAGYPSGWSQSILYGGKPALVESRRSRPISRSLTSGPAPHFPSLFTMAYQFTTADGRCMPAQYPGPTLHVQPGDTLNLTIHNSLDDTRVPSSPVIELSHDQPPFPWSGGLAAGNA